MTTSAEGDRLDRPTDGTARPAPRSLPIPGEDLGCPASAARPGATECPGLSESATISMDTCWRCLRSFRASAGA